MSKRYKKSSRNTKQHRRRKWLRQHTPTLWVGGLLVALVLLIGGYGFRQARATRAVLGSASRSEQPETLLPLAPAVRPLEGGHDMALIPEQPPQPQPAVADVAAPHVDIPNAVHDFGTVAARPDVAHIFTVQNTGTADLEISNLVTSCGCTTAQLTSSVIPPGQRADLTVVFDPDFHETSGPVTRLVWFMTNDVTQPWVEVRVLADVQP